jgi:membrane glycosyltransferase
VPSLHTGAFSGFSVGILIALTVCGFIVVAAPNKVFVLLMRSRPLPEHILKRRVQLGILILFALIFIWVVAVFIEPTVSVWL